MTFTQLRASAAHTVRTPSLRATLMLIIPALVAVVGLFFYLVSGRYVSTDNAYVGAQKVLITPEVSGKVLRIAVVEGQQLTPGEELFSIDPEPYRLAALEAEARLARVKTDFDNLKSTARQPRPSRSSCRARASPPTRRTTTARSRCSTTASARRPTSTSRG